MFVFFFSRVCLRFEVFSSSFSVEELKLAQHCLNLLKLPITYRSCFDARRLYVLPFKSYFSCIFIVEGSKLFMTVKRMFLPPH